MTFHPGAFLLSVCLAAGLVAVASPATAQAAAKAPAAGQMAEYEVELRFTGYSGLATSQDCDALANLRGFDVLTGTVRAVETSQRDEDVTYTGTLARSTAMDFCLARGRRSPTDDEVVWCIATLTGSAVMDLEITVYGESDRGAFVQAKPGIGPARTSVGGGCNPADMREIEQDYPSGDSGGSPSGQLIDDARATDAQGRPITFVAGRLARLRVGSYPPDPTESNWTLKVIRKIR